MLGKRLHNERRNTCRYGCCVRIKIRRSTKNERQRDARNWKKVETP